MSHGLHALSDLTFNFQSPEPQTVATFPRISPVNVPQFSAPSQTATSTVPTNTSSSAAQPHVHVQPHPNVFQRTRAGAANQNGQQNGTAVSSAAGAPSVGVSIFSILVYRFSTMAYIYRDRNLFMNGFRNCFPVTILERFTMV